MIIERIMRPGNEAKVFLRHAFEEANRYRRIGFYALLQGKVKGTTVRQGLDFKALNRMINYFKEFGGERKYLTARSLSFLASQALKRHQYGFQFIEWEKSFLFYPTVKTFKKKNRIWLPVYQKYITLLPLTNTDNFISSLFEEKHSLIKTATVVQEANNNFKLIVKTNSEKGN